MTRLLIQRRPPRWSPPRLHLRFPCGSFEAKSSEVHDVDLSASLFDLRGTRQRATRGERDRASVLNQSVTMWGEFFFGVVF